MPNQIVHFEIIGREPAALRAFYRSLFGWEADTRAPVAPEVSDAGEYGFIDAPPAQNGIPGGIGGGPGFAPHALFYVGVDDVETALELAERLGGKRMLGPAENTDGAVVVGHFADPEGNVVGVAAPRK
jgi:predicted enzyme related to lactoylglutathione lyase